MAQKRHTSDQIVAKLRKADLELGIATSHNIRELCARVPARWSELGPRGVKKLKRTF